MKEQHISYDKGIIRKTVVDVETPTEDIDLTTMTEEDAREDPIFAAIVNHVTRKVQQSGAE